MSKDIVRYAEKGMWGRLGYRIKYGNPWIRGEQPLTETERFQRHPFLHGMLRAAEISQAIAPARRIVNKASDEKSTPVISGVGTLVDYARVAVGGYALYKVSQAVIPSELAGKTQEALAQGTELKLGSDRNVRLPGWLVAFLASGSIASVVGAINYLEKERNETALREAPLEAKAVRAGYDKVTEQKKTISINGQQVAVTGDQELARQYATKFLNELSEFSNGDKRAIKKAVQDARALVQAAFSPDAQNVDLQNAIRVVAGDAYEAILLEKEMPETAGVLTSRPRDQFVKFLRELPSRVDEFPLLKWFTPEVIKKMLKQLSGEQNLVAGNLNLDPRAFINAGSAKTLAQVQNSLRHEFEEIISEEEGIDANGYQITLINHALPTGLKISDRQKDGIMNTILASVLIEEHPELAPRVAGIVGVLDVVQNRPDILGSDITSQLPSYRRRMRFK